MRPCCKQSYMALSGYESLMLPVSEIKGAPCTRGALFNPRVHGFLDPCTRKCILFLKI